MLTGLLGIRLIVLTGQTVPTPASYDLMSALAQVVVMNDMDTGDGFELTLMVSKSTISDYDLLTSGSLAPFTRVVIGVLMGITPEVLINGVITHVEFHPSNEPGMSRLIVKGQDVRALLNLKETNAQYKNQPDSVIVYRTLLNYAQYGLAPPYQLTTTTDIPLELQRTPRQHETDLRHIKRLAKRNGFVFYVAPLAFGVDTAYWGPETRLGIPQPALSMNLGPSTNVTELTFSHDPLAPVGSEGSFVEPITRLTIPIPPLPSLKLPPLASSPTTARRTVQLRDTANQNPAQAAALAIAAATNAADAVQGHGKLETVRFGSVLHARQLVGVRGAGFSYDGTYFVRRVKHTIARGVYTQDFTLSREGTGTLVPVVRSS